MPMIRKAAKTEVQKMKLQFKSQTLKTESIIWNIIYSGRIFRSNDAGWWERF